MSARNPLFYQTRAALPTVDRGEGVWLIDQDGRRYLDGCSGAVVATVGHAHPHVLDAMRRQAEKVTFAYRTQFENEPARTFAARLGAQLSQGLDRVFFVSGGSEAVETAIKLARSYHAARGDDRRYRIVSRFPSYHGATLGALAATGYRPLTDGYAPMMVEPNYVTAPTCYHCPFGLEWPSCGLACAEDLERVLQSLDPSTVAAFVLEPIGGAATGATVPPDDYFAKITEIARRHGILLIYDEVMTGSARTGAYCAYQHWEPDAQPDILALSKGLGAGYTPLGAVVCRDEMAETVLDAGSFPHGFSYAGNPLSCAVGLAVFEVIEQEGLIIRAATVGEELGRSLRHLADRHPMIGDVRGKGMLWGLEFVADRTGRAPFPFSQNVAQRVTLAAAEEGLLLYPRRGGGGLSGDHVLVAPPLTIAEHEVEELLARLDRTLARAEADLGVAA
ncbi:MAG: aminotransferase class III-fold pyridoxal phosphate-dependent enzyme [Trueperaceae bacterium]|nr:aminotransferase class III-fold pyridoxal phosphate-dependent enzyme [Trueperaceae bacterium]